MFRSRLNCSVMDVAPKVEVEFIEASPAIWPNCRSSGAVTVDATTSGEAPGYCAETCTVGKSTAGRAEMGRSL